MGRKFTVRTPVDLHGDPDCAEIDRWLRAQGCRCRVGFALATWKSAPRLMDYGPRMVLPPDETIARLTKLFRPKWGIMEGYEPWARFAFRDPGQALLFKLTFGGAVQGQ